MASATKKNYIMGEPKCNHKVLQANTNHDHFKKLKRIDAQKKKKIAPGNEPVGQTTND